MERGLRFGKVGISLVLLLVLRALTGTGQYASLSSTGLQSRDASMEQRGLEGHTDATVEDENGSTGETEEPSADNETNFHQHGR